MGTKDVMIKAYNFFVTKYHLGKDKKQNRVLLEEGGYNCVNAIISTTVQGTFVHTEAVGEADANTIEPRVRLIPTNTVFIFYTVQIKLKRSLAYLLPKQK